MRVHEIGSNRAFLLIAACLLIAGVAGCGSEQWDTEGKLPPIPEITPEITEQVHGKLQGAYAALQKGDPELAVEYAQGAVELAPEAAMLHYHLALALAAHGDHEAALAALQEAVSRGFAEVEQVEMKPVFSSVAALEGWVPLKQQMLEGESPYRPLGPVSFRRFDPSLEPAFESLEELNEHFREELGHQAELMILHPKDAVTPRMWRVLNHKVAALERLREQNLSDEERFQVDNEILRAVMAYESPQRGPWLATTVAAVHVKADRFLREHPEEEALCAQAEYMRARASWLGTESGDDGKLSPTDLATTVDNLVAVDEHYPGTLGALFGLMDAMETLSVHKGLQAEEIKQIISRIQADYMTMPEMQRLRFRYQPFVLANEGLPAFTVTDLDGREWSSQELSGQVTLIDFWATWCAPCSAEIPNLVALYEEYKDRGFEILSISLDDPQQMSPEALRGWTKDMEMTWPLVYDGKGWESPVVRQCGVSGIPFPILVDREGNVIAAATSATGKNLRQHLEKLFADS